MNKDEVLKAFQQLLENYPTGQEKEKEGNTPPQNTKWSFNPFDTIDIPAQTWTVENLLPTATVTLLYSDPGIGKTYIGQNLLLSIASGKPWFGRFVTQSPVLWIDGDMGHYGALRRMRQSLLGFQPDYDTAKQDYLNDIHILTAESWDRSGYPQPNLCDRGTLIPVQDYILAHGIKFCAFDTLRAFTQGMDENSSKEVTTIFSNLKSIRDVTGCSFLLLHHANKGGTGQKSYRGSTSFSGDLDTVLTLEKKADGERILKTVKARYSDYQSINFFMTFTGQEKNNTAVTFQLSSITEQEEKESRLESLRNQVMDAIKTTNGINRTNLLTALNIKRKSQREDELDTALAQLLAEKIIKVTVTGNSNRKYSLL